MTNKEKIVEFSWNVNNLLSEYVAIHNDVFNTSIRHIIPIPGIFKVIDFGSHLEKVENIVLKLKNDRNKIKSLPENAHDQEQEYLNLLSSYVDALVETVNRLKIVVGALYAKSQNFTNSNYDWKNYKGDLAKYKRSVRDYMAIGEQLNELFKKIK